VKGHLALYSDPNGVGGVPRLSEARPLDQARRKHVLHHNARSYVSGDTCLNLGGGAACASDPEPARRVHTRGGFRFVVHPRRSRTPGISCERPICSTLVSFIPLFGGPTILATAATCGCMPAQAT
jgi:hypothetical protein